MFVDKRLNKLNELVQKCTPSLGDPPTREDFLKADAERIRMAEVTGRSDEWFWLSGKLGRKAFEAGHEDAVTV